MPKPLPKDLEQYVDHANEQDHIEFKSELYDLDNSTRKEKLAKVICSLANANNYCC